MPIRKIIVALAFGLTITGCHPHALNGVAGVAMLSAAVVGTAAILAEHDAHYHDYYCGHSRRWHNGRWVYQYDGAWEYYDPGTTRWYHYH